MCMCICVYVADNRCTHHHFVIDLPRGHVFHSHGHGRDSDVALAVVSRGIRHVARRRWDDTATATDDNNNNKIRRRDAAQPKNRQPSPSPSPPVAFAPPLWFFHLLRLLSFYLPHSRRFLLLFFLYSFVGVSSPFPRTSSSAPRPTTSSLAALQHRTTSFLAHRRH